MEIITQPLEMASWSRMQKQRGKRVGLVPTMGCLHAGHLALMQMAEAMTDALVASIFVNPLQFGPQEDYGRYPRPFEEDLAAAQKAGVQAVYAPVPEVMYPSGFLTTVSVAELTQGLCGGSRPGHFDGVTTVVTKLFNAVQPDVAVFGEKDFQQLAVLRRMTADLDFPVQIVGHPIVREPDGLAMSSRNRYLSSSERRSALCLYQAINQARDTVAAGTLSTAAIIEKLTSILGHDDQVSIDYLKIVHQDTLLNQDTVDKHSRLMIAVKIGKTRLIDNGSLILEKEADDVSLNA